MYPLTFTVFVKGKVGGAVAHHDLNRPALHDPVARARVGRVRLEVIEIREPNRDRDLFLLAGGEADPREALQLLGGRRPAVLGNDTKTMTISSPATVPVFWTLTTTGSTAPWLMSVHPSWSLLSANVV